MLPCLITGVDSGIGKATAKLLAKKGFQLILLGDSKGKLKTLNDEIISETKNSLISTYQVDLSLQREIRSFCTGFKSRYQKLDILINNAGVNLPYRRVTSEGFEYMLAVNYLAPFLMTILLMESLKGAGTARIINIGSNAEKYAKLDFENLQGEKSFDGMKQYSLTKLCNLMFAYELARNLNDTCVAISCLHPRGVRTEIMQYYHWKSLPKMIWFTLFPFLQAPEKAAGHILDMIESEASFIHGHYFFKGKRARSSSVSMDRNLSQQLWQHSLEMTNMT